MFLIGFEFVSDDEFSYRTLQNGINIYNVVTREVKSIIPPEIVIQLKLATYHFSADRNYVLYSFDNRQVYRYSGLSRYSVIDLANSKVYPLQPQQLRKRGLADPQLFLRYATWNRQGNAIVYVHDNDIYVRPTPDAVADVRLTQDGQREAIFNGVPDWIYEEEVLSSNNAIWLSKSGQRMVYASFDDRQVDTMEYSMYGVPGSTQFQYPVTNQIRYPKAGRTNPNVTVWMIDMNSEELLSRLLEPPPSLIHTDHYFTTVSWTSEDEVMVSWLNRHQNVSMLSFCSLSPDVSCQTEYELNEPNGWIDLYSAPKFSASGRQFLMVLPTAQGDAGNFKHLVLYDRDHKTIRALTSGRWEVTDVLAWNEATETAYFMGTAVDKPAIRHMYSVSTAPSGVAGVATPTCETCGTLNADQKECTYNSAEFSPDFGHYVHGCDGPNAPRSVIKDTQSGEEVLVVSDNEELRARLSEKAMPRPLTMQVPVEGNYFAQVRLLLPPSLNRNKASKYPLLVYVYGGPQSQQVSDRFRVDWGTHLSSSRGVIYAMIDGRGSGFQGDKMLHEIYRRMGTVEIQDQIAVTKYLAENLPFVDANRTAIWGWSYGGFAAASTLGTDKEGVFQCAMSVAPVTNWIYYDSIYTERYMGLPTADDNEKAYVDSDISRLAGNFRNKKFYLVHGTADDNVHYQQSLMLAKSLEAADVLFRQQSYTDENHSIGRLKKHLYHSLGAFLMTDCFGLENEIWG